MIESGNDICHCPCKAASVLRLSVYLPALSYRSESEDLE